MTFEYAFFSLLLLMMIREVLWMWTTQKLLNKAMSRSYHEYQVAENVCKPREDKIKVDDDLREDLGSLQGII
jgi:hypothetical protein